MSAASPTCSRRPFCSFFGRYFVLAQHEGEWKLGRFHSKAEFVKKGFAAGRTLPLSIVLHVDEVTNGTKDATRFNVICMTTSNGGAKLYKFQVRNSQPHTHNHTPHT